MKLSPIREEAFVKSLRELHPITQIDAFPFYMDYHNFDDSGYYKLLIETLKHEQPEKRKKPPNNIQCQVGSKPT